jgi:hypothetical protein
MLRFFRIIRKKLMEQHKVRSYILYAIGEILLVVIGILIALQVNNWNEQSKTRIKEKEVIKLLIRDLENEKDNLLVFENRLERQENAIINLLNGLHNDAPLDSIFPYVYSSFNIWNYRPSQPTYEGLKQNGQIDIISKSDIRDLMISHFEEAVTYLDDLREISKQENSKARDMALAYLSYEKLPDGSWDYLKSPNILQMKNDPRLLNQLTRSARQRGSILGVMKMYIYPSIDSLNSGLSTYLNSF